MVGPASWKKAFAMAKVCESKLMSNLHSKL